MSEVNADARSVALKKRGTKQTCENADCSRRFYDLQRTSLSCPYCGTNFDRPAPQKTFLEILSSQKGRKKPQWSKPSPPVVEKVEEDTAATEPATSEGGSPLLDLDEDSVEPAIGEQDDDETDAV